MNWSRELVYTRSLRHKEANRVNRTKLSEDLVDFQKSPAKTLEDDDRKSAFLLWCNSLAQTRPGSSFLDRLTAPSEIRRKCCL